MKRDIDAKDLTFGIPMYNAEKTIKKLLGCFKESNKISFEVIIYDDCSTDESVKICEQYPCQNMILIKNKKNLGVSHARNEIIKRSSGAWVTFLDSDDYFDFKKYEEIFLKISKNEKTFYINTNKKHLLGNKNEKKNRILPYLVSHEIINTPCCRFYNRKILNSWGIGFCEKYTLGEDLLFNLEYYKAVNNVIVYNKDMYFVNRCNAESLTRKLRKNKYMELMSINEECKKLFKEKKIDKAFEYIRIKNCISCVKDMLLMEEDNKEIENLIGEMKKDYRKKYLFLNSLRESLIYNTWYIMPARFSIVLIRRVLM